MEEGLWGQVIISSLLGGMFIALLTFLAENVDKKIGGIVLVFPSVSLLGFFFLGYNHGPEKVAEVIPAMFIPWGMSLLYVALYFWFAYWLEKIKINKILSIIITLGLSIGIWAVFSIPVAIYELDNIYVGICVFILLMLLSHFLLHVREGYQVKTTKYRHLQKVMRVIFVGVMMGIVVLSSKLLGPFFGGIFVTFPTAISSMLMIYHYYYSPRDFLSIVQKVPIGSFSITAYMLAILFFFPQFGIYVGTLFSAFVSILVSLFLVRLTK